MKNSQQLLANKIHPALKKTADDNPQKWSFPRHRLLFRPGDEPFLPESKQDNDGSFSITFSSTFLCLLETLVDAGAFEATVYGLDSPKNWQKLLPKKNARRVVEYLAGISLAVSASRSGAYQGPNPVNAFITLPEWMKVPAEQANSIRGSLYYKANFSDALLGLFGFIYTHELIHLSVIESDLQKEWQAKGMDKNTQEMLIDMFAVEFLLDAGIAPIADVDALRLIFWIELGYGKEFMNRDVQCRYSGFLEHISPVMVQVLRSVHKVPQDVIDKLMNKVRGDIGHAKRQGCKSYRDIAAQAVK